MRTSRTYGRTVFLFAFLAVAAWSYWASAAEIPSVDAYPIDTCIVLGGKLGAMGDPVVFTHEGREIRLCCAGCKAKFEANPKEYLDKLDKAIIEKQKATYPLDTCVVLGGKLGDKPVDFVYKNRLIRFCCADCIETFKKDPAKYLAKLNEAVVAKQKPSYPLAICPVMGGKIVADSIDVVVGDRLVRLCCPGCIQAVKKEPAKFLAKLDAAKK
jgi:YHS domain-containing protein